MSLIKEFRALTPLRRNQQIMSFFLLFVNALMLATSMTFYVDLFGSEGLILKNYAFSLLGLLILIPFLGRFAISKPLLTFRIGIAMEVISCAGYFMVSQSIYAPVMLLTSSFLIFASNLLMNPILNQVESIVTDGCAQYSLLKSKMNGIYTAVGAGVGAAFVLFDVPMTFAIFLYSTTLFFARLYRNRVLNEVYGSEDNISPEGDADSEMNPKAA